MEDRKEFVERLRAEPMDSRKAAMSIMDLCIDAADEIETLESLLAESEAARADLGKRLAAAQQEMAETKAERDATVEDLRQLGFLTAKLCEYCRREGDCEISDDEFDEKWPDCFEWRCLQRRA